MTTTAYAPAPTNAQIANAIHHSSSFVSRKDAWAFVHDCDGRADVTAGYPARVDGVWTVKWMSY